MNEMLSNIVLNRRHRYQDWIFSVHRRTLVFSSIFIVGKRNIDVQINPMINSDASVNIDP